MSETKEKVNTPPEWKAAAEWLRDRAKGFHQGICAAAVYSVANDLEEDGPAVPPSNAHAQLVEALEKIVSRAIAFESGNIPPVAAIQSAACIARCALAAFRAEESKASDA